MRVRLHEMIALVLIFNIAPLQAIEVAPRISDREIIESLVEIKAELKSTQQVMQQRFETIDQRFEAIDQRFESMEKSSAARFESMERSSAARFESMEKNSADRFSQIWSLMLVMIAGIFGLIGFIIWDRKTALKPLEQRLDRIEHDLRHDLDMQHEQGSRMTRLINALREMAQKDENLAGVLRSFSLL